MFRFANSNYVTIIWPPSHLQERKSLLTPSGSLIHFKFFDKNLRAYTVRIFSNFARLIQIFVYKFQISFTAPVLVLLMTGIYH
jgi:hypothetical protein